MRFENPNILWLLLLLPTTLVVFFWWAGRKKQLLLAQFIEPRLAATLTVGVSPMRQKIRWALLVGAAVCLIIAVARPQWGFSWEETKQRGLDIVMAIDTSKSMLAEDIAPNRLARAKLAALDLMQQAKSDRLGLIVFAGSAFMQCPLTVDDVAFRQSVESLDVNTIPQGGTAIAEAIDTAMNAFKFDADNHQVLVIFTDGEDHDPGAIEAATKAAQAGMRIFTVGIGSADGELLRVKDANGNSDYVRDADGNVVKSRLNESLLQDIAHVGNGFYQPLRGANTIDMLYERGLAPLPKSESTAKLVKRYFERFYWPLALAIICLMAELLFPERKRAKTNSGNVLPLPQERENRAPAIREATRVAAILGLLTMPFVASASPAKALREYNAGKFDEALKDYKGLLERKSDDARLQFNAGAAAYRDGQFEEAAKHFSGALAAPDLKLQQEAYYNLANTLYRIGEQSPEPDKQKEAWDKSLANYDSTLKLNQQDTDAKFNQEFVKKKLEELKQQQSQQSKSDQNQSDQNKEQQNQQQQNQQQQNQGQQDQKNQQQQQNQQSDKQDQNQASQQKNQEQKQSAQQNQKPDQQQNAQQKQQEKQSQAKNEKGDEQKKREQASAQSGDQDNKEAGQESEAAAYAKGQLTPQQARQLLDSLKSEEAMLPVQPKEKAAPGSQQIKDW